MWEGDLLKHIEDDVLNAAHRILGMALKRTSYDNGGFKAQTYGLKKIDGQHKHIEDSERQLER